MAVGCATVASADLPRLPDDLGELKAFAGLTRPGGRVVLLVPAFPSAMSRFDLAIGRQRRYRRAALSQLAQGAGLNVEVLRHVNSIVLLGWYVVVKGLRAQPKAGLMLTAYDHAVVPWLRRAEARSAPPFGQSLFLVARKQ
jgi:hypothetical protein